MKFERQLLEDTLTAEVLVLSRLMDAEKRKKGIIRHGVDYRQDAIDAIKQSRAVVIQLLSAK